MNQIAYLLNTMTLYRYPLVMALAIVVGFSIFFACCAKKEISAAVIAGAGCTALVLSLLLGRLLYWNCRADSFDSLLRALTTPSAAAFALAGAFLGCGITALVFRKAGTVTLLDCMSVAGAAAIALGRLGNFFTTSDRGQILTELTSLPWAFPVLNAASGLPEYRFATFLFQSFLAAGLFAALCLLFFSPKAEQRAPGSITLLFLLVYCAGQVILDSTRYDSLYLRINGFVSMVQILAALGLAAALGMLSLRAVKSTGLQKRYYGFWLAMLALFGCAGYMEYFVQRHGRLALFAYLIMEHCLVAIVTLGILLWRCGCQVEKAYAAVSETDG